MHHLPFDKPGRFYRGNLHSHSTRSDGHLTPEALCAFYREAGYDFLAVTDHFMAKWDLLPITDTRPSRTADFTTLLGAELRSWSTENGELWHLLAAGLPLDFAPTPPEQDGPALAARAVAAGAYLAIAHPAWYALQRGRRHEHRGRARDRGLRIPSRTITTTGPTACTCWTSCSTGDGAIWPAPPTTPTPIPAA